LALVALLLLTAVAPAAQGAAPPLLTSFGTNCLKQSGQCGGGAGETVAPRGVVSDPTSGNYFVVEQTNSRIDEFNPWGVFIRSWGWGVVDGSLALQTCTTSCKKGIAGSGEGQVASPQGIAIDGAGDIYVVDYENNRVEKFDLSGANVQFVWMIGGDVNKTKTEEGKPEAERNLCTAASGDVCQVGTLGGGAGQFGNLVVGGDYIDVDAGLPTDVIYVGDEGRIQRFDTEGQYLGSIAVLGERIQSLATGPDGNLYLAFFNDSFGSKENVKQITPAGANVCSLKVQNPRGIAVSAANQVYVINRQGQPASPLSGVKQYDGSTCAEIDLGAGGIGFGASEFKQSIGIATSSPPTCNLAGADVVVSNSEVENSFLNLYGSPPDPNICPPPEVPPTISAQFATKAGTDSATVRAQINPNFWPDTTYIVEYGTGKCFEGGCTNQQPLGSGSLLTKDAVKRALTTNGVLLSNLSPDTTYHFRFVAKSSGGGPVYGIDPDGPEGPEKATPAAGLEASFHTFAPSPPAKICSENQQFRIGFSAPLPDCRAYEMVSPVDKNNGDVFQGLFGAYSVASSDGVRSSFSSYRGFANPEAAPFRVQYLASRDATSGWSTSSISPPRTTISFYESGGPAQAPQYKAFTKDLCQGWFLQDTNLPLSSGAPDGFPNLYRRSLCGAVGYELLTPIPPPGFPGYELVSSLYFPEIQGFSVDGLRSVFRADAQLTPDACATPAKEIFQVYVSLGNGQLRLVSVKPNGQPACTHSSVGTAQSLSPGEAHEDSVLGAVSADAERVYWTDSGQGLPFDNGTRDQPGTLYLRINAAKEQSALSGEECTEPGKACTLKVSGLVSPNPARFLVGSKDGSAAYFSIGESLYRFDLEPTPVVTEVTKGFKGLMGAGEDLTRVYMVSSEVLDAGASADKPNVYLLEGGGFGFIGTLASSDTGNGASPSAPPSPIATVPLKRRSRVTPDGLHAAFMSAAPLTGFDSTDANSGQPDAEVFLYDAAAEELICASCNPSGARPAGRDIIPDTTFQYWAAAQIPGWASQLQGSRSLSDDGQRLFFESYEALVPRDTNGKQDVYLWQRAKDKADCEKGIGGELFLAENSGCLSLISSGESPDDSEFMDASADGSSAFFLTNASLLPQDRGLVDVYVARVNGGFPPPPPPPPPCEGDGCQSPQAPPAAPAPSSATFRGVGNVKQGTPKPRCPKGKRKVRRSGKTRCVARRAKNKRKAR
jgi:hypothetical protein